MLELTDGANQRVPLAAWCSASLNSTLEAKEAICFESHGVNMEDIPFQPQCSVCVAFIRDKATSYVSSCGHLFCPDCFVSPDTCSICREPCDYLSLTDTTEYPDLHSCLFGTFKAHAEKLGAMVNVRSSWGMSSQVITKMFQKVQLPHF